MKLATFVFDEGKKSNKSKLRPPKKRTNGSLAGRRMLHGKENNTGQAGNEIKKEKGGTKALAFLHGRKGWDLDCGRKRRIPPSLQGGPAPGAVGRGSAVCQETATEGTSGSSGAERQGPSTPRPSGCSGPRAVENAPTSAQPMPT